MILKLYREITIQSHKHAIGTIKKNISVSSNLNEALRQGCI